MKCPQTKITLIPQGNPKLLSQKKSIYSWVKLFFLAATSSFSLSVFLKLKQQIYLILQV